MENNGFNIPIENFIIQDGNFQSFDQNHQNYQFMPKFPMLSMIQNEPINNGTRITNPNEHFGSNFASNDQMDVPISATALASLLASRIGQHGQPDQHGQHESLNYPPFGQSLEIPKKCCSKQ
ncbi:hypothetical protein HanRHA438_Chr06g0261111 [Helianthus annuus]|nr:hypothetical protein HanRHA438_Chr06g0261111 [Helianthus annuus]